uniref:Olfactory marker protein b n=1 Tax=Oncorhynchus tshawytscha TaxID=74940 RepID=A0A8C8IU72_ONCTS
MDNFSLFQSLPFQPDLHLTKVMLQRVQSLQQRGGKRQDGERLLRPHKAIYHLDFSLHALHFTPGACGRKVQGAGVFWRAERYGDDTPVHHYEADGQEFGERIEDLEKVRKTMYFLLAFEEGVGPDVFECSISFQVGQK